MSTSATCSFCKHSNSTPSPTIPVAPVMITFIGDMILKLMLRSSGEKVNESLGGKMKVWEEKYVMGEYIPHPLTPLQKWRGGNVHNCITVNGYIKRIFILYVIARS